MSDMNERASDLTMRLATLLSARGEAGPLEGLGEPLLVNPWLREALRAARASLGAGPWYEETARALLAAPAPTDEAGLRALLAGVYQHWAPRGEIIERAVRRAAACAVGAETRGEEAILSALSRLGGYACRTWEIARAVGGPMIDLNDLTPWRDRIEAMAAKEWVEHLPGADMTSL